MTMIYTGTTISFHANGKFHQAHKSHPKFDEIVRLAKLKDLDSASKLIDLKTAVTAALAGSRAELRGNAVYFNGQQIHSVLGQRILTLAKEGFTVEPLLRFLENLMLNPSKRAVDELYGFLEASKLPITDDGHFLAYKSVRQDYTDHHTGTMDNSVGKIVSMPRNQVDEDKDRTCSKGLHFAAHEYASGFGSSGRMVVLKINPKDVVAIPSDYNNQKGRACEYLILEEVARTDTKLVGASVVPSTPKVAPAAPVKPSWKPKFPVGTKVAIAKSSTYYTRGNISNPKDTEGTVTTAPAWKHSTHGYVVKWSNGRSNTYNESDLELYVAPAYVPEADNYKKPSRWSNGSSFLTFIGNTSQFPVNRDVAYTLSRKAPTSKLYRGDFFFTSYNTKTGSLVFQRLKHDGSVDRYVTVTNVKDWDIMIDKTRS